MHHKLFAEKMYCGSVLLKNCWGQLSKSVYLCISTNDYVTPDIFKYSCVLPFSTPCLSPFFFPPFFFFRKGPVNSRDDENESIRYGYKISDYIQTLSLC